jgi:hypothetical protein
MFIVCILILTGIGFYAILKPPTELYDKSLKNDIFPELKMNSTPNANFINAQPFRETGNNDFN